MSSANALADAGLRAVTKGEYADGIDKLTRAIDSRDAPLWYLERSKAYLRTNQYDKALHDAETALYIAYERANRDLMTDAQLRRAITLHRMQRFADADVCAFWAYRLAQGAKAREDDGQRNKVDEHGDYLIRAEDVKAEAARKADEHKKKDGLAGTANTTRTKTDSQKNLALTWRIQSLTAMDKLPSGHDGRKIHLSDMYPDPSKKPTIDNTTTENIATGSDGAAPDTWEQEWSRYQAEYKKHKLRYSFYQSETGLNIDIFVKNLSSEQVTVESSSHTVTIRPAPGVTLGFFGGPIVLFLADEIDPQATKLTVKSMKIEVSLKKKKAGKWPSLRCRGGEMIDNLTTDNLSSGPSLDSFREFITSLGFKNVSELQLPDYESDPSAWYVAFLEKLRSRFDNQQTSASETKVEEASTPSRSALSENVKPIPDQGHIAEKKSGGGPAYPTSSKNGPKNWDKMELDDEEDSSKDADVNSFFQKIYKDSDEDTKRAMMKSFIESNGTALSTSWSDAEGKTYKTQPPDGAEAKKWE